MGALAAPEQDAAVAPATGGGVILIGGLDESDVSLSAIDLFHNGADRRLGDLPGALHDASAVSIGGAAYLFGGGNLGSTSDEILRVDPATGLVGIAGRLPVPASDVSAAEIDGTAYIVGGYDGQRALDTVVAWRPGGPARVVARLPRPLRYAAVTAVGGRLLVAGGSEPVLAGRDVLTVDPSTGSVQRLGRLPFPSTHAAAATLGGYVYLIGGRGSGLYSQTDRILAIDPKNGRVSPAGKLPTALSDLGAVEGADHDILVVGGRNAQALSSTVLKLTQR